MKSPSSSPDELRATPTDRTTESRNETIQASRRLSQECPICDYSLVGLPVEHRCPECGFQFDQQTMIWEKRYTQRLRNLVRFLGFLYLGFFLFMLLVILILSGAYIDKFLILAIFFAVCVVPFLVFNSRRRLAAVSPSGVILRLKKGKSKTLPWNAVREARSNRKSSPTATYLVTKHGRKIYVGEVLETPQDVIQFTQAIDDGVKQHARPTKSA
ncbi:MAG: hypothetical protein MI923_04265 [Phycisphaerales bacterium]|nr:hypothetical protein [Phycisphaerales bacterium]